MGEIRGQTGGGGKVGKKGDSVTAVLRGEREGSTVSNLFFSHLSGHPLSPWPRFTVYTSYSDGVGKKSRTGAGHTHIHMHTHAHTHNLWKLLVLITIITS